MSCGSRRPDGLLLGLTRSVRVKPGKHSKKRSYQQLKSFKISCPYACSLPAPTAVSFWSPEEMQVYTTYSSVQKGGRVCGCAADTAKPSVEGFVMPAVSNSHNLGCYSCKGA